MVDMVWNMVIYKNFINQIVMNFTKCVFKIQQSDDYGALLDTCLIDYIWHLSCVFQGPCYFWSEAFLNFMPSVIVL